MVQSLRGQEDRPVKGQDRATYPPSRPEGPLPQKLTLYKGEVALRVGKRTGGGGRRADLPFAGLALFCLGILLSFLATAATTTEVSSAPAGKAVANEDGEPLVRLDKDATSAPLTTPAVQEARETEEGPVRASLLTMLVVAVFPFFKSGLVLLARNCSLKGGVSHSIGVLLGSSAGANGGASVLGVF